MNARQPFLPMEKASVLLKPVLRWTAGLKERLLAAIVNGVITEEQARRAHGITAEELDEWTRGFLSSETTERLRATRRVPTFAQVYGEERT